MNSARYKNLSLKYLRLKPKGCKEIEIRKFEFVAKTQFILRTLLTISTWNLSKQTISLPQNMTWYQPKALNDII